MFLASGSFSSGPSGSGLTELTGSGQYADDDTPCTRRRLDDTLGEQPPPQALGAMMQALGVMLPQQPTLPRLVPPVALQQALQQPQGQLVLQQAHGVLQSQLRQHSLPLPDPFTTLVLQPPRGAQQQLLPQPPLVAQQPSTPLAVFGTALGMQTSQVLDPTMTRQQPLRQPQPQPQPQPQSQLRQHSLPLPEPFTTPMLQPPRGAQQQLLPQPPLVAQQPSTPLAVFGTALGMQTSQVLDPTMTNPNPDPGPKPNRDPKPKPKPSRKPKP